MQKGKNYHATKLVSLLILAFSVALCFHPSCKNLSHFSFLITSPFSSDHTFTQILVASSIGIIIAAALHYRLRKHKDQKVIPRLKVSDSNRVHHKLERFPHYVGNDNMIIRSFSVAFVICKVFVIEYFWLCVVVDAARQLGFKDRRECPQLCKLATEYIRKFEGFEEDIYNFFSSEPDADSLFVKLVEEFERCILSYFAFHWSQADMMITQILSCDAEPKKKLKNIVMAATREQRFERVTKNLKVARVFTNLVEEMKAMGLAQPDDSTCTEVMAPVAHADRSPVLHSGTEQRGML